MSFLTHTKNFAKRWVRGWRLVILIVVILLVWLIGHGIYAAKHNTSNILTDTVKSQDLKQTVLATGVVTSSTDLNLSFKASGNVTQVNVKVGDKAKTGQILATLDQKDQQATLTSARGALASAQANYDKVVSGASSQDVAVAQAAVDAANAAMAIDKNQQQVLVSNALSALLNSTPSAVPSSSNTSSVSIAVTGSYNSTQQGSYKITSYTAGDGLHFTVSGLESMDALVKSITPIQLGTRGLSIQFSSTSASSGDSWTISIPNMNASNYVTNLNSYNSALQNQTSVLSAAQSAIDQAQAQLNLKQAQARPADIEAAQAQILTAQGQVQAADAALENTIIRAPAGGTITRVDIKLGQSMTSLSEAIVLQNIDQLHLEADISEANIAQIKQGQPIDVTFDALGPDDHYTAEVTSLDLSSTVISGVVNYKLVASLDKVDEVRPGMTANMTILTREEPNALAVPSRAILSHDGNNFVRLITNDKTKSYQEQEVTTGFDADGGLTQIVSGLSEGQEIVTLIK